jgi:lipopolysaccharide export system protein LptC
LASPRNNQRRLKIVLIFVIGVTIGIVVVTFLRYRNKADNSEPLLSKDQDKASISIGKVHHTATRDGKKEWSLVADSAHYMEKENRALFKNLEVVFYMDDGSEVSLTADRGYLQTESNDIQVEGNVQVNNGTYRFETRSLNYYHKSRFLRTNDQVNVSGAWFTLSADAVSVDLNEQRSEFKGNVKGVISEDILL